MSDYEDRKEERLTDIIAGFTQHSRKLQNIIRNAYDVGYASGREFEKQRRRDMTLDEAIKHAEEVADAKEKKACNLYDAKNYEESRECIWCAEEHRQLAEWLKELKEWRELKLKGEAREAEAHDTCPCGREDE